jgi:DNA-binding HxlR family transcriptional regulator
MRPEALAWSADNCTIGRATQVLGQKWTLIILREVFVGIRRFDDLRVRTAIPRQVLTTRLAGLVRQGLLRREPYREPGERVRDEYRLTRKGLDLYPVLVALAEWGGTYLADPDGPPVTVRHRECEEPVRVVLRCAAGHELEPRAVALRPGPGRRPRVPASG